MSISGSGEAGDLSEVLNEVKPDDGKKLSVNTEDTEEKDLAVQMLAVFIDELKGGFADWIDPASKLMLSLVSYEGNESIRNSVAGALPGLVSCAKEAFSDRHQEIVELGRGYMNALWEAIKKEDETDTIIC